MKKIVTLLLVVYTIGCASPTGGVIRTDLTKWKTIEDQHHGILIDMPADELGFSVHYIPRFMSDALWMLSVFVTKVTPAEFADNGKRRLENASSRDKKYLDWINGYHAEVSSWETGTDWRRQYRKDITTSDNHIVSVGIEYNYRHFTGEQQKEDEQAIRRILESVRPINNGSAQPVAPR